MVKSTETSRYTEQTLECQAKTEDAFIIGEYNKLTSKTTINFICVCGNINHRVFSCLFTIGLKCKPCTYKNMIQKTKEHCINKFGCSDPNQLSEIKQKVKHTFTEKYGVDSPMKTKEVQLKIKNVFIEKYGVENPFQSEKVKDKIKKTNILKYGVEHPLQNQELHDKFKQTMMTRFGVEVPYYSEELKNKGKETCIKNYGVEHPLQNQEIIAKIKKTCMDKYGVENPSQNVEQLSKRQQNAKKYKKYTMPSGEIRNIQGYEHFAIRDLLIEHTENEIKTNRIDIPRIEYQINSKKRYYFPDIFIPSQNKIIEVKSDWTYKSKTDHIQEKADATKNAGYLYEIWVYNCKGNKQIV